MLISSKELHDLTGYKRGKEQCDWLSKHGWVFEIDRFGRPKVSQTYYDQKLGVKAEPKRRWQVMPA